MTKEDKELVFRDLCARLPHGVVAAVPHYDENGKEILLQGKITGLNNGQLKFEYLPDCTDDIGAYNWFDFDLVKPYLRPLSSMTEEEKREFYDCVTFEHTDGFAIDECCGSNQMLEKFDWLNAHHFDYRGLIHKGLALSTDEFNPYKN